MLRHAVKTKALLKVQFLLTFLGGRGEEQEALALLSKKGGGEGRVYREFWNQWIKCTMDQLKF